MLGPGRLLELASTAVLKLFTPTAADPGVNQGEAERWKKTAKYQQHGVQPLNCAGKYCKYLFDSWILEVGIGKVRNFFFLAMDGMPTFELMKLHDKSTDYHCIVPLRFNLHEEINELKAVIDLFWHTVFKDMAKAQGLKTTSALTGGSATHKKFGFILTCYESMLSALGQVDIKRQLLSGTDIIIRYQFGSHLDSPPPTSRIT
jgi:hypothetical protein